MKKNYFLAVFFSFAMISLYAQFTDDMESYGGGNTPILGGHWDSWDHTEGTAMLSSGAEAQSGVLSGWVDGSGIDPLLLLGNKIFGSWGLKFSMYVPSGSIGYWNIQGQEEPGIQWVVGNIYFGNSGIGGDGPNDFRIDMSTGDEGDDLLGTFPNDEWFDITMNWDINAGIGSSTWQMWINTDEVVPGGTPFADGTGEYAQALGGLNIFSISGDCSQYFDDFEYINDFFPDPGLGVNDLNSVGFSAYPNPVTDILNLRANEDITSVSISNILGQTIYSASVGSMNSTVDMSSYSSGTYFVTVQIGDTEGTVKVLR
jgi:hypothetical protein